MICKMGFEMPRRGNVSVMAGSILPLRESSAATPNHLRSIAARHRTVANVERANQTSLAQ